MNKPKFKINDIVTFADTFSSEYNEYGVITGRISYLKEYYGSSMFGYDKRGKIFYQIDGYSLHMTEEQLLNKIEEAKRWINNS